MLRAQEGVVARALEFAILTATRSGEVLGARWDEINLGERVWTVPAKRIKAGREHRVPLSDAAMAILGAPRNGEVVFSSPRRPGQPLSHMAMLSVLTRLRSGVTVHGFRSTFAQWAAERTAYPHEVREMALAHTIPSAVERAYQRSDLFDRRRRLMEDWARACDGVVSGEVVELAAQRG
jgi:integrase